ncbi:Domain of uncharacterised function (DUF932) [Bordetella ansorpii]|uniref:Domain of uncharacterized function (DUF932) n=1 Tax=Bordetella ansorpii TaxID=288768 RepID=A0A157SS20_9BORD|nr:DUF932 domain-containing protein [Bordetella ansorpii]SAI73104.1 Domain of uncharacterised function (DUF932) [Bordetella ansorpii]
MQPALASRFGRYRREFTSTNGQPLTEDQLRNVAPSIFADGAHESRSARYAYIPTIDILRGLRAEGFEPYTAVQAHTRKADHHDYTKHLIRLRHRSHNDQDTAHEIILLNSHNGSSAYQMLAGAFRFVCANGLICGDAFQDIRIPHKGDVRDQVLEGANVILEDFGLVTESRERMRSITVTPDEARAFATAALQLRYDGPAAPISPEQAIVPRRAEDARSDLWSVFNRTQENLVRGGLPGRSANSRRITTRAINGIDQGTALNRALWTLADEMAKLKS